MPADDHTIIPIKTLTTPVKRRNEHGELVDDNTFTHPTLIQPDETDDEDRSKSESEKKVRVSKDG